MDERKSRYELFLEEEERKAQPPKKTRAYPRKYKNRTDRFWKTYWEKVERVGDCLEWTGMYKGYRRSVPYGKWDRKEVNLRRLVYRLALGEIPDDMFVVTTCRNRRCVRQFHLRRVTEEEYNTYRWDRTAMPPSTILTGERVGTAKLNEEKVRDILHIYAQGGVVCRDLACQYGVHRKTISDIVLRRRWKHVQ